MVTPGRGAHPTVLDVSDRTRCTAQFPDHVLRARDVAVVHGATSGAGADQDPATLSGHRPAIGAVRGGAALLGELGGGPDLLQPVAQGSCGVHHKPAVRPAVLHRSGIPVSHSARVADDHARGPGLFQKACSKARRPVGGQLDDPPGPGLGDLLAGVQLAPRTRARSAGRPGLCPKWGALGRHLRPAGFGVLEVQELLGPRRPARDEESLAPTGHGQWVDDPGVHAGYEAGGGLCRDHRHPGCEVQEELAGLGASGARSARARGRRGGRGRAREPGSPLPFGWRARLSRAPGLWNGAR